MYAYSIKVVLTKVYVIKHQKAKNIKTK